MSDKNTGDLFDSIKENWDKLLFLCGIVAGVVGVIPLVQKDPKLYISVTLGVIAVIAIFACIFYAFFWQPEADDGKSSLILPGSDNPIKSQGKKEKQRKIVRRLARLGLIFIPLLLVSGLGFSYYQSQLPPTDFKILVANFEPSDEENHGVTEKIFSKLEREMEKYDDVKVEKLGKTLESIQVAKKEGKEQKAAIVIWGSYQVMPDIVPISVNFEILKESTDYLELGESVQGDTPPAQLSELNNFNLQTSLSKEMTYLSLFTLGMYRYLDNDLEQAISYHKRALEISSDAKEPIVSLGIEIVNYYLGNAFYYSELYEESLKSYDQAIKIKPDYHEAWYNRGYSYAQLNNIDSTIKNLKQAFSLNPELREFAKKDSDLDELRRDKRFKDLMNSN